MRVTCILIACGASLAMAATAQGQFQGTVHIAQDTVIDDDRIQIPYRVGYANQQDFDAKMNGVSVTFTVTENGKIHSAAAYNGSVINNSGFVWGNGGQAGLGAFDSGTVNMTAGFAWFMGAGNTGTINLSGGHVKGRIWFEGSSQGNIGNAIIGDPMAPNSGAYLEARQSSAVIINGAQIVDELRAINGALLKAIDTTIGLDVIARNTADIQLRGSAVGRDVFAFDTATVRGTDGTTIDGNVRSEGGSITLTGATVGKSVRSDGGTVTVIDSSIGEDLQANATLRMSGGIVQGSAAVGEFGSLLIGGGQVVGNVTATGGQVDLGGTKIGGNVSASGGSINAEIAGNLISTGTNTNARLTVMGGTIAGDLLANGRGTIVLSAGAIAGDAVANGNIEMTGGSIGGNFAINSFATIKGGDVLGNLNINTAIARMEGGRIGQDVNAAGAFYLLGGAVDGKAEIGPGSLLFMAGGTLAGDANLGANSQGQFFGGTAGAHVNAPSGATVTIDEQGNIAGNLVLGEASSAVMRNGTVGGSVLADGAHSTKFNMSGGSVGGDVVISRGAQLEIAGGAVAGEIIARDTSAVSMTGGQAEHLHLSGIATAIVSDGSLGRVTASETTTLELLGGQVTGLLRTEDAAAVTIHSGAIIANIEVLGDNQITMKGGSHTGFATLRGTGASMFIEGGNVGIFDVELGASLLIDNTQSGATVRTGEIRASLGGHVLVTGPQDVFIKDVFVRDDSVAFLNGGDIEGLAIAWDNSTLNVTHGAIIRGGMRGRERAAINMDAGDVRGLVELFDDSTLAISGGTVAGNIFAHGENFLDLDGGQMELVRAEQKSEIIFGGAAAAKVVQVADFGRLIMHGGRVATDLVGTERAVLSVSGTAIVKSNLIVDDDARLHMVGGEVQRDLISKDRSVVFLSGGAIRGFARIVDISRFHWSGGTINGQPPPAASEDVAPNALADHALVAAVEVPTAVILMHDSSTLNIVGNDLDAMLIDPNYQGIFSLYQLLGTLADGTPVNNQFFAIQNGTGASYQLLPVPEPATITLLLPVAILLRQRSAAMRKPK